MTGNIMIVGVGGQGTLLTSRILGAALIERGYDVKVSEVHGMSQRGGSVVTYVRYGESVASPLVEQGEADVILAFEELEAYRTLPYLKAGGKLLVNTQAIDPMPVITGAAKYPEGIVEKLKGDHELQTLDALSLAKEAGSPRCANVVLSGLLARNMDLKKETWLSAIRKTVPAKLLEVNEKAFELGYTAP